MYGGKVWSAGSSYKGVVILTALKLHGRHLTFGFSLHILLFHIFFYFRVCFHSALHFVHFGFCIKTLNFVPNRHDTSNF